MRNSTRFFSTTLSVLSLFNISSPIMAQENYETLEEVKVKKVNKKGNLIVKFCRKMKDFDGFVKVNDLTFPIDEADKIKPRKIVWEDVNLPSQKGKNISTDNLIARYYEDKENTEPLKILDDGECGVGILPLLFVAGLAAGAGSGGGSGSNSSN